MVKYHVKVGWDKLKTYNINSKTTTKITRQRTIHNKPIKEIKSNHKKRQKKMKKEQNSDSINEKQ